MTLPRALFTCLLLAALGAPPAAGATRMVMREEPVGPAGMVSKRQAAPLRFDLVGLHWRGPGSVEFRTGDLSGAWSNWREARPELEDLPDLGTKEARASRGWKLGNPYWTGPADGIQYRLSGEVTRLRAFFLWSEPDAEAPRALDRATRPGIISRAEWGADESIVRAPPSYASRLRFAVVHHTAGTNSYSAPESAAIVRGIQRYHVLANGWNDIGYNFLVDKYGQVFEGRGGGIDRNVIGAHAQGFNTGSTGVSVLGTYTTAGVSSSARGALVRLLAWRLDVAHVDPTKRLTWISGGNPEYPAGTAVRIRTISGHRDTGPTTCPGSGLYGQLSSIAAAVEARGLPKLYDPEVAGGLGGPVRVTGRLSSALPWSVTIRDGAGGRVAEGSGSGTAVDWTWDAADAPYGSFTYTIEAGPDVRPWTAAVPGPPPLAVRQLKADPAVLAPDGDGALPASAVSFSLTTGATVTVDVLNSGGTRVRRLAASRSYPAGTVRLAWDGRDGGGAIVADGRYTVSVAAVSPGQSASDQVAVVVDRTLRYLAVGPRPFSPNGDGARDVTTAAFELERPADLRVRVLRGDERVLTLLSGSSSAGARTVDWNGRDAEGKPVPEGRYTVRVAASTTLGTRILTRTVRLDVSPPSIRILSATAGTRTKVELTVSEDAYVKLWFGPTTWQDGDAITLDLSAGRHVVRRDGVYGGVRIVAWDKAENRSAAVKSRIQRS